MDEAVQLAATGYGPGDAVPRTVATAEVAVLIGPGGGPLSAMAPDGAAVVPAFTSPTYLHAAGRFGYERIGAVVRPERTCSTCAQPALTQSTNRPGEGHPVIDWPGAGLGGCAGIPVDAPPYLRCCTFCELGTGVE